MLHAYLLLLEKALPDVTVGLTGVLADRYAIECEIGRGGMATVYLARDLRHGSRVAVKVLHPDIAPLIGEARFNREIQVTARLQHPNILPVFDSGRVDGISYYVTPYVEGESLAHGHAIVADFGIGSSPSRKEPRTRARMEPKD